MNKYVNEAELIKHRQELKSHCHKLINLIFRHIYGIKLLLVSAKCLESIADYKANRSGNYVEKFPMTLEDIQELEASNQQLTIRSFEYGMAKNKTSG
ncbi:MULTISPECIES: hypothetical protein [Aphanizomenon]|uniref:hypothetical protein n=1 Tax=Aphanizomenon TaxID=1175 RepID=UPI000541A78E|nr:MULTISPECIES: hypothetical protein [Aphanizomenon]KHG41667.1 hypothetical protein OA07_09905 [Aphanizomenon flos-aquae 2012/KM1/D3]MDK2408891.1 hypothetical protein [Aphanizomenon sp. 202]MDK2459373.1 hypothetical protein [Aphanizomenon sp. PH219]MTJ28870.1 hypothetical protein [Aphanizomenon sp. UHCC 0183]